MDADGDRIRRLMAVAPHPSYAGRVPPTEEQLRAIEDHLLQRGFHPNVVQEHQMVAQLMGAGKAMEEMGQLEQRFPHWDGVPETAARSSREDYFDDLNANAYNRPDDARARPKYPSHMRSTPQKGTSDSYSKRSYKRGSK